MKPGTGAGTSRDVAELVQGVAFRLAWTPAGFLSTSTPGLAIGVVAKTSIVGRKAVVAGIAGGAV